MFIYPQATLSATDRFALIVNGLCRVVAARFSAGVMSGPFIVLIWRRLQRVKARFEALAAAIRSGTLRVEPARSTSSRHRVPGLPTFRWPRRFGWLLPLVPNEAACYASQLRALFEDPEMAALVAATPRVGRALRPLCHMLCLEADLLSRPVDMAPAACNPSPDETTARVASTPVSLSPIGPGPADADFPKPQAARPPVPT